MNTHRSCSPEILLAAELAQSSADPAPPRGRSSGVAWPVARELGIIQVFELEIVDIASAHRTSPWAKEIIRAGASYPTATLNSITDLPLLPSENVFQTETTPHALEDGVGGDFKRTWTLAARAELEVPGTLA